MVKIRLLAFLVSSILVIGIVSVGGPQKYTVSKHVLSVTTRTHTALFWDEHAFYQGITQAEKDAKPKKGEIFGAVIPHHLFVSFEIAAVLQHLSSQKPTALIMIGPNHYERGNGKILTSRQGWQTPFGVVEPQQDIIEKILAQQIAHVDETTLEHDHALSGLMPYVKYYLPTVTVIPVLLSGRLTYEETNQFAKVLPQFITPQTILVASVDFSHYLPRDVAKEKDIVTEKVIKDFNARQLFSFGNQHLDSPPSLATVFLTMQQLGAIKHEILYHTNSGELLQNATIPTTTHFAIEYYK